MKQKRLKTQRYDSEDTKEIRNLIIIAVIANKIWRSKSAVTSLRSLFDNYPIQCKKIPFPY